MMKRVLNGLFYTAVLLLVGSAFEWASGTAVPLASIGPTAFIAYLAGWSSAVSE